MDVKYFPQRTSWALVPVVVTTLICGVALTVMGLYVFFVNVETKFYLGFGLLAGLFAIVAGGAGIAAVVHRLHAAETAAYGMAAVFSAVTVAGLLIAIFQGSKDYPTYKAGVIGGAMCSFAAISLGTNLAGIAMSLTVCWSSIGQNKILSAQSGETVSENAIFTDV